MMTSEDLYTEEFEENLEPLEDDDEPNAAGEAPAEADTENTNKETVKPKRVVRNPQPKLNAMTLKGKRGLTALPSYFDRVKYKGRGYEEQDLSVILKTYEYWCHRLFPKYPFDDCISKIEKLGSKRAVVTQIKKIRLDMIYEDDIPIINNDNDSEVEDINQQFDHLFDNPNVQMPVEEHEEQFERIRINKEKAEKLRREKLRKTQEFSESQGSSFPADDQEEDINIIFDKIQSFDTHENVTDTCLDDVRVDNTEHVDDAIYETNNATISQNEHFESFD
ncbi:Swi3 domain containing protein [Asbolus verrucosus]|uniref:TIMELESS-interacting protein n=1 Tax=Asbolus verrucosus TaxID=1661398 RepID=A0A482W5N5_ASBVE|nr:Swi3 domain containing protein [Asbolus verrucosus]